MKKVGGASAQSLRGLFEALEGRHPRTNGSRAQWSVGVQEILKETMPSLTSSDGGWTAWMRSSTSTTSAGGWTQVDEANVAIVRLLNLRADGLAGIMDEYMGGVEVDGGGAASTSTVGVVVEVEEESSSESSSGSSGSSPTHERSRRCTVIEAWLGTLLNAVEASSPSSFAWESTFRPLLVRGINVASPAGKNDWCYACRLLIANLVGREDDVAHDRVTTIVDTVVNEMTRFAAKGDATANNKQFAAWLDVLKSIVEELELCLRNGSFSFSSSSSEWCSRVISRLCTKESQQSPLQIAMRAAQHPIGICRSAAAQCLSVLSFLARSVCDVGGDEVSEMSEMSEVARKNVLASVRELAAAESDVQSVETALGVLTSEIIVHSNMRYTPMLYQGNQHRKETLLMLMECALRHQNFHQSGKEGQLAGVAVGTLTLLRGTMVVTNLEDVRCLHNVLARVQQESENWHTRKQIPKILMTLYVRHLGLYSTDVATGGGGEKSEESKENKESDSVTSVLERLLLSSLEDKKSVEVQEAAGESLTTYLMTIGSDKDSVVTSKYIPMFREMLTKRIPKAHPLTEKDEEKIKKRFRTIRNRTIRQRAGMLGLCAVVNAYPHHVPTFVPEILVEVARIVGGSKGTLKTSLFGDFRKSKEDGWLHHKRMFTSEQYEFLQEYFLGGNYYA